VAFLESYFDESYRGKSALVVAGFVSSIDRWAKFASRWKGILDENRLPYFRFSEFKNPGSFRHLPMPEREKILNSLIDIILECAAFALSCRISPREYQSLTTAKFRSQFGSAYTSAVTGCIQGAGLHLKERPAEYEQLSIFLEEGHPNAVQAIQSLLGYKQKFAPIDMDALSVDHVIRAEERDAPLVKIGAVAVGGKTAMLPLQAGDMLAHSTLAPTSNWARLVLERVRNGLPHYEGNWTKEAILESVDNMAAMEQARIRTRKRFHSLSRLLGNVGIKMEVRSDRVTIIDTRQQKEITHEEFWRMVSRYPEWELIIEPSKKNK
jgi:hypothetical protein